MRSIFVFLRSAEQPEVERWLDENYTSEPGSRALWNWYVDGCAYLQAIECSDAWRRDSEPEEWQEFVEAFGSEPSCCLVADVTGCCDASQQVRDFVLRILHRFEGAVMDDYTSHPWARVEIESGGLAHGHPFFDAAGWYQDDARER